MQVDWMGLRNCREKLKWAPAVVRVSELGVSLFQGEKS